MARYHLSIPMLVVAAALVSACSQNHSSARYGDVVQTAKHQRYEAKSSRYGGEVQMVPGGYVEQLYRHDSIAYVPMQVCCAAPLRPAPLPPVVEMTPEPEPPVYVPPAPEPETPVYIPPAPVPPVYIPPPPPPPMSYPEPDKPTPVYKIPRK